MLFKYNFKVTYSTLYTSIYKYLVKYLKQTKNLKYTSKKKMHSLVSYTF